MSSRSSKAFPIEQGYCYLVDMNPGRRSKPGKIRPVVVIQSSDTLEAGTPGVVVVPLTTKTREENVLRCRVHPTGDLKLTRPSDALLDQVHTIDRSFFLELLGALSPDRFERIRGGVGFLLGFKKVVITD